MKKAKRPSSTPKKAKETPPLKDLQVHINQFGQIVRDIKTDDINAFLDETVPDKKFNELEK